MPWILYRYIVNEMLKLLVVSTVVLVLVISVAAAIKPLSDGMLDPLSLTKFVLYTTPTMLQFVLPVAGAFASTLVFSRMTSDNEVLACSVSGLSYGAIALPVVVLGLVLTVGLYLLGNLVVPSCYRVASQELGRDLATVLINQVQKRRALHIEHEGLIIYADRAAQIPVSPELIKDLDTQVAPSHLIMLEGVAVGKLDAQGRVRSDTTAERADAFLFGLGDQTWVTLRFKNMARYDPTYGEFKTSPGVSDWGFLEIGEHTGFAIPNPLRDDVRFLTWSELRRLRRAPEGYDQVRSQMPRLASAVASERLLREIQKKLVIPYGTVMLMGPSDEKHVLRAPIVERVGQSLRLSSTGAAKVSVDKFTSGRPTYHFEAAAALLWMELGKLHSEPRAFIELTDVHIQDRRFSDRNTQKTQHEFIGLRWPEPMLDEIEMQHDALDMLELVGEFVGVEAIEKADFALRYQIRKLLRKIIAQTNERLATSFSCLFVLLLGALLSMRMRGSLPLVIYFWSFLITAVAVIITRSGENVATSFEYQVTTGLFVIWSGNLVLLLAVGVTYWKLAKN